ncbi:MAG TPA: GatB/YqeY domain-containing protein [Candidatus Limnocylindrales bacterium]
MPRSSFQPRVSWVSVSPASRAAAWRSISKAIADYRAGKPVLGFFVGQVMKATRGQANAAVVQDAVRDRLEGGPAG